ncbi:translation initiation factor eIF-1A [archaeon]|nr:translation initiation factor eIF-1A [Nanoarchaeota archaeon]MBU4300899.1 translation initiation factor eIF-1A [Nanoarchaeota archaeon]MBU4451183.1 translation initiation factor eIF-1A [Nanoarchaeota archaeon]MCG2723246.1 translation initiation factor eIF-1A [archaeon]
MIKRKEETEGQFESMEGQEDAAGVTMRVRTPRPGQLLGIVESRLGFGKMNIICSDRKARICRVPGKYRQHLWVKEGEIVLVEPWQFEGDKKGDIIYKYRKAQASWLHEHGYLKNLGV